MKSADLADAYARAAQEHQKLNDALVVALDRLKLARTDDAVSVDAFTSMRYRVVELQRKCEQAWDDAERARRLFWIGLTEDAEQKLIECALPLLAAIDHCSRAGAGGLQHRSMNLLQRLDGMERPPYVVSAHRGAPPELPARCDALDRAEDEIW